MAEDLSGLRSGDTQWFARSKQQQAVQKSIEESNGRGESQRECVERKVSHGGRPASRCRDI